MLILLINYFRNIISAVIDAIIPDYTNSYPNLFIFSN